MPTRKPKPSGPSKIFQILYEVGLLLAISICLLLPFHESGTRYLSVIQNVDASHVAVANPGGLNLSQGQKFPVFRYNRDWTFPIGNATVDHAEPGRIVFSYDPATFRWPMGRHGVLVAADPNGQVTVNMGAGADLVPGNMLDIFDHGEKIGILQLTRVDADRSFGLASPPGVVREGLPVSEFEIPTEIVALGSPTAAVSEWAFFGLLFGFYGLWWVRYGNSPLRAVGDRIRGRFKPSSDAAPFLVLHALLGVPFVWLAARFLPLGIGFVLRAILSFFARLFGADVPATTIDRFLSPLSFLSENPAALYAAGGLVYLWVLIQTKKSPILIFWNWTGFKGGPLKGLPEGPARDTTIWLLHLVIAYAFMYSIINFIGLDLNDALQSGWSSSGVSIQGDFNLLNMRGSLDFLQGCVSAAGFMLSHVPTFASPQNAFTVVKDLLFVLTILGCLLGYLHSIFGFLWGKKIRNLDFTVPGWVTNAICYGPLLGWVLASISPPLHGVRPSYGSGPLASLTLFTQIYLNALYMLTIFNLGTMFGVMTDKGVRKTGFYGVVRHPSYTAEACMFLALELQGLTTGGQWFGALLVYFFAYWIRSEREDNFMFASNPEYAAYRSATPYKFIPGIY